MNYISKYWKYANIEIIDDGICQFIDVTRKKYTHESMIIFKNQNAMIFVINIFNFFEHHWNFDKIKVGNSDSHTDTKWWKPKTIKGN